MILLTEIYIVRHCQATGNVHHIFQGSTDSEITPCGAKQLEFLAARFAPIHFDAIYSSPRLRARLTAEAINRTMQLPIQIDDDLREIYGGCIEGMTFPDIFKHYPDLENIWNEYGVFGKMDDE